MLGRLLNSLYAHLLSLYPDRFTEEFGGEMSDVFSRALGGLVDSGPPPVARRIKMARLFLREVWDFPRTYLDARRYRASSGAAETPTASGAYTEGEESWSRAGRRAPWSAAFLGALPFLLHGLVYLITGITELDGPGPPLILPEGGFLDSPLNYLEIIFSNPTGIYIVSGLGLMIVIALGLLFGVWKGFPRWSYAYLGISIYIGWFSSRLWGWLPLFAALTLGLLLGRSRQPLTRLRQGAWNDWTRLSFSIYAFALPVLTVVFFDDPDLVIFQLYGLLFDTVLLAVGAVAFLRARTIRGRALALAAPVLVLVLKGGALESWWDGQFWTLVMYFTALILFLFVPAAIGVLKEVGGSFSATQTDPPAQTRPRPPGRYP